MSIKQCVSCKKKFNPSYDFLEDLEAFEAITYFTEIENLCEKCTRKLISDIIKFVNKRNFKVNDETINCQYCKKEFNPNNDFTDMSLEEGLSYFIGEQKTCPSCIYNVEFRFNAIIKEMQSK